MLGRNLQLRMLLGYVVSAYWKASPQNYSTSKTPLQPSFGHEVLAFNPPKSNEVYEARLKKFSGEPFQ